MPVRLDHHGHGSPSPLKIALKIFYSSKTPVLVKPDTAEKFLKFFSTVCIDRPLVKPR